MNERIVMIESRSNPWFKQLRQLIHLNAYYKQSNLIWVEGEHLVEAALEKGLVPECLVVSSSALQTGYSLGQDKWVTRVLADRLFEEISQLPSSAQCAALFQRPKTVRWSNQLATVVLDRIQDIGNVGSILRSAAAFGFAQVIALKGTAALWSAKTVRAGMGAHFSLSLYEDVEPGELQTLQALPWLATSSHSGVALLKAQDPLPWPLRLVPRK